jgi:hypothetical protein
MDMAAPLGMRTPFRAFVTNGTRRGTRLLGEFWQDIRVRGFGRILAARVSLAVSGAAHVLAGTLERSGRGNTWAWRAARGLHPCRRHLRRPHHALYPAAVPDRMDDVRRIVDDLGAR